MHPVDSIPKPCIWETQLPPHTGMSRSQIQSLSFIINIHSVFFVIGLLVVGSNSEGNTRRVGRYLSPHCYWQSVQNPASMWETNRFYPARMICYNIVILPASFYMHNWCHMWYMTSYFRITERLTFPHRFIDMATSLEQNRFFPNKTPISKSAYPKKWKCIQKPWGPCKINKKMIYIIICIYWYVCVYYIYIYRLE